MGKRSRRRDVAPVRAGTGAATPPAPSGRRRVLGARVVGALALAATVWAWRARQPRVARDAGLSVLLITVDTLRADALGSYGHPTVSTPWLDRLAAGGVRFERAHAHNVVTLPSHANILSGRYPLDHGVRDNAGFRFPEEQDTLATLLETRGWRTGAFVSAFPLDSRFGLARGFDVYDDRLGDRGSNRAFVMAERPGAETVEAARRWLEAQGGARTFCWVHLFDPHFPYAPPEPFASRYRHDPYHGEVAATDAALAPLLEPLLAAKRSGRTLVVMTSDHGESLGEHGEKTHGIFAYEGTLRVPLVFFAPGLWKPRVTGEPARHVDILPTVLDALGLEAPAGLPGRSLLPALAGATVGGPAPENYFESVSASLNRGWAPLHGILRDGFKYVDLPLPELYDLGRDPREERNLAASQPERLERLRAALHGLRTRDRGPQRTEESAEVRERLQALGYVTTAGAVKDRYTDDDDPKRLIVLDAVIQDVVGRYVAGDLPGALATCRELVRRRPDMALSSVHLAFLEREVGDLTAAVEAAKRALALNPHDAEVAALLGAYLNEAGRSAEALALLEPYARRDDPDLDVLIAQGVARSDLGQPQQALATFEQVRRIDPSNALALVNIGTVHLMGGDVERGRAAFEAALEIDGSLARAHNSLGVIAARAGRTEEAIARWRRAVALDPRDYQTLYNLGTVLRRLGRTAEARPYLESYVRTAPVALESGEIARVRAWLAGSSVPVTPGS
ncbi:MAG TPA: sulfatase-like hydrolase/transferase [Vicinamibacteria bacterium]|nr:sulfatase-like hydrolase/transferase [Vicinamibacteria bacterium]